MLAAWSVVAASVRAYDDYGYQPRIVRRVTIDGPVSVGIDGGSAKNATATLRLLQRRK
jgi:hypothetical protein